MKDTDFIKKQGVKFKSVKCNCGDPQCSGWQMVMKTSKVSEK